MESLREVDERAEEDDAQSDDPYDSTTILDGVIRNSPYSSHLQFGGDKLVRIFCMIMSKLCSVIYFHFAYLYRFCQAEDVARIPELENDAASEGRLSRLNHFEDDDEEDEEEFHSSGGSLDSASEDELRRCR